MNRLVMTCRDVASRAHDYVGSGLRPMERVRMRVHLAMCHHCRRYLRQVDLTVNTLRPLQNTPSLSDTPQ